MPQLADAEALFPRLPNGRDTAYMVLIPNHKGYERARAVGAQSVALVLATTDTFNHNLSSAYRLTMRLSFAPASFDAPRMTA